MDATSRDREGAALPTPLPDVRGSYSCDAGAAWRDVPVLAFALLFPLAMAWVYFIALDDAEARTNQALVAAYGIAKFVMLLLPLAYVWWFEPAALRPAWPSTRGLLLGVGFGVAVAAGAIGLYHAWLAGHPWATETPALVYRRVRQFGQADPAGYLLMALGISVVHSLFEEYYWRWFVFGRLRRYLPLAGAIALSSIGFMLHHVVILYVFFPGQFWTLAVPFSLGVGVGGAFWAWLYQASGSLYAPWLSHLIVDAGLMVIGRAMLAPWWA